MAQTRKVKEDEQKTTSQPTGKEQPSGLTKSGQNQGLSRREQYINPFGLMNRFSEEMNRLFNDFGFGTNLMPRGFGREFEKLTSWSPQTEVFERDNQLVIRADLPGMSRDDINVDLEDDRIIIQGERHNERETEERGFYQTERSYGSFYRVIPLPEGVDGEQAKADFQNGVLEITMPKPEQKSRTRRLEIGERGN